MQELAISTMFCYKTALLSYYLIILFSSQDRDGVGVGIRKPYLRVVGIQVDTEGPGRSSGAPLNPLEEEEFNRFASRPDAFETIAKSIAPFIYGSEDVKKAIACLLFGGSRKRCEKNFDRSLGFVSVICHYS